VEEIMPMITHALTLRSGRILMAGTKRQVLCDRVMSEVFGCRATVRCRAGRYGLTIRSGRTALL
jgi:ABC-type hemin transport system ATPase subunit